MAEYIEKEKIINKCKEHRDFYIKAWGNFKAMPADDKKVCDAYATCWADVVNEPAADVQPTARKPIKITEDEFGVQGYLVNEKYYCCPNCDKVLGNLRVHNVHELINEYKFCSECGQGLDWGDIKE